MLAVAGMKFDTAITRVMPSNAPVIISIAPAFFVLVATQVVCTKLLAAPSEQTESSRAEGPITEADVRRIPLMGVLAISPQAQAPMVNQKPIVHIATSVMEMAQTFGLTGREVEVLTLYALGHTQARVSEEQVVAQHGAYAYQAHLRQDGPAFLAKRFWTILPNTARTERKETKTEADRACPPPFFSHLEWAAL